MVGGKKAAKYYIQKNKEALRENAKKQTQKLA